MKLIILETKRVIKQLLLFIIVALFLMGCATSHKITKINVGMTKDQVIATMGRPVSISAKDGVEYLNYNFTETVDDALYGLTTPYYVRVVNGRVDSYGRHGDFRRAQTESIKREHTTEIQQDADAKYVNKKNLYKELLHLKELKDEGMVTEEEFEVMKKRILQKQ